MSGRCRHPPGALPCETEEAPLRVGALRPHASRAPVVLPVSLPLLGHANPWALLLTREEGYSLSTASLLSERYAFKSDEKPFVRELLRRKRNLWVFRCDQRRFAGDFVVEGVEEEAAVLGANVVLTASTPIIDVTGPEEKGMKEKPTRSLHQERSSNPSVPVSAENAENRPPPLAASLLLASWPRKDEGRGPEDFSKDSAPF